MSRPRTFDLEHATDQALHVFWAKGYEGTTLGDLTSAMGIARPSLYAAFGSKEGLFRAALERYVTVHGADVGLALGAETGRETVVRLLRFYADAVGRPGLPAGCLLVQGALVCGDESEAIRHALRERRQGTEAALAARLERARREGEPLPAGRPADLARYVWTLCHGLSVQAADGATRDQLRRVAALALTFWPEPAELTAAHRA